MRLFSHGDVPVTLVGNGPVAAADLSAAIAVAPRIVAADGGARAVLDAGLMPDAVVGDCDSLDGATRAAVPPARLHRIADQETTDFEKCLAAVDAPFVIGVGFTGGRSDHTLAALSALVRSDHDCVLIDGSDVIFHCGAGVAMSPEVGSRLSLFPLAPTSGRSEGLEWPIEGLALDPMGRIGTSNRVAGPVRIVLDRPGTLVIVARRALAAVLDRQAL